MHDGVGSFGPLSYITMLQADFTFDTSYCETSCDRAMHSGLYQDTPHGNLLLHLL